MAEEQVEPGEDPFALELADQYGSHFYWDTRLNLHCLYIELINFPRYKKKSFDDFEWYFGWREMKKYAAAKLRFLGLTRFTIRRKLLDSYLTKGKETKILMLGCGNSCKLR